MMALTIGAPGTGVAKDNPIKIGVVDVQQVTRQSRSVQATVRQAQEQIAQRQDQLDLKSLELERGARRFDDQRSVMTPEAARLEQSRLDELKDDIELMQAQLKRQLTGEGLYCDDDGGGKTCRADPGGAVLRAPPGVGQRNACATY